MNITKKAQYTYITPTSTSFHDFFEQFKAAYKNLQKEHLLVQLSNFINITKAQILVFLNIATQHKQNGTTFVVINASVSIDDFPEELNITPTLVEAEDILEMENIERELGF